jgi:hypothetical protein
MFKSIMGALIGIAIIMLGFYVWYVYVTSLGRESNSFLFWLSLSQVGIGTYVLFWASKSSDPLKLHAKKDAPSIDVLEESDKIIRELSTHTAKNENIKFIPITPKKEV